MSELVLPRRRFIQGLISLVAAPAVVRIASLMPVKSWVDLPAMDYGLWAPRWSAVERCFRMEKVKDIPIQTFSENRVLQEQADLLAEIDRVLGKDLEGNLALIEKYQQAWREKRA